MASIPKVRDDDPEDVSWALSTAATQFARGDRAEALKWLRRAAEAASEAEHDKRALELAKAAAELTAAPPAPTPKAPAVAPKGKLTKPRDVVRTPSPPPRKTAKGEASETGKRVATKTSRRSATSEARSSQNEDPTDPDKPVPTSEADAWPTETMAPDELESLADIYGQERTRIGALAYDPRTEAAKASFHASQAVPVVVWRAADGSLRIAPKGTSVSAVTIEALLVAPGPDVDLVAWLGG